MKITEVAKECRAKCEKLWGPATDGQAIAYGHSANMLEETIHEIQNELGRFKAEAENEELSKAMRADAKAMAAIVEWILGKKNHKGD